MAKDIHDNIIELSGGRKGIKDIGNLESALATIQNNDYYATFAEKLAKIIFSVIKNHSFEDGNKRTSLALGAYFLNINGYDYCVQNFFEEFENLTVAIADDILSQEIITEIINNIIYKNEYSEELKLILIHAYEYKEETYKNL